MEQADKVRELQNSYPDSLHLEVRTEKAGLGTAYIHGFKWALAKGYSFIFEMDADFSHTPSDLVRLHAACENGADVAIGSRYCKGSECGELAATSNTSSPTGPSFYVRLITGMPVYDPTAGFMCYRASLLKQVEFRCRTFCRICLSN
jgi:dolichol-phosphate mannosyltransferase